MKAYSEDLRAKILGPGAAARDQAEHTLKLTGAGGETVKVPEKIGPLRPGQ